MRKKGSSKRVIEKWIREQKLREAQSKIVVKVIEVNRKNRDKCRDIILRESYIDNFFVARERNQNKCDSYCRKKSRGGRKSCKSEPIFERLCRVRPSHFSILMPQKRQRVKSPSGDSPAGDVYRRKRERETVAVLGSRGRRDIRRGV